MIVFMIVQLLLCQNVSHIVYLHTLHLDEVVKTKLVS